MNFPDRLGAALRSLDVRALGRPLALSALVGLVAGLGALAFYFAVNAAEDLFLHGLAGYHGPGEGAEAVAHLGEGMIDTLHAEYRWFLFLIPVIGGLVSGWLVFTFAPEAEGHGTDAAIDAFHNKGGLIRSRVPIIKAVASMATIGTGGSAGREGPIAQIGAGFGSFLATKLKLSSADRRVLLLAGMAGGIGATFRAPLGGALFAVEVLYQDPEFEHEGLIPAIISSIVAYSLFGAVTGWKPLLATPLFRFENPPELVFFLLLGVLCAGLGKVYVHTFYGIRDRFHQWDFPQVLKPAVGGLMLGLLAMVVPQVLGSGYGMVQAALYGKVALWVMLLVALAKILATSLTISSGGSGGVFAPSLVIGAMLGGAFGATAEAFFPALVQDPRAYVLIGMAGFFAGVSNTPVATLIMVSELTGNYGLLAPLMLVCVVAMLVFRKNTIYQKQVPGRIDSPAHLGDLVIDVLEGIHVADLAEHGRRPHPIPEDMPLTRILEVIADAEGAYYPVVDGDGNLKGIFSVNDIRRILAEDLPPGLVLARDIANAKVITTRPDETLTEVMRKLTSRGLEEIPVLDLTDPRKVHFMLSRRAVLAKYASELEKKKGAYAEV
ncbi:MAG: chloride channel protein [Desulfuromonas sp.]|uniref:chloride channel protein n=1 Tax=Desulfuromonas sp. TaxID=892 RepID=UPI000CA9BD87|nr:chloride channel protein [Desulfuromonas sp.]PLX84940.1 MAG: chloride channel protein [Desulfuromonas sp.]